MTARIAKKKKAPKKPSSKKTVAKKVAKKEVKKPAAKSGAPSIDGFWSTEAVPSGCFDQGDPLHNSYGVYLVDEVSRFYWFGEPDELVRFVCRWAPITLGLAARGDGEDRRTFESAYLAALGHLNGRGGWKSARRALASLPCAGPDTEIGWIGSFTDLCEDKDRFSADARELFWDSLDYDNEDSDTVKLSIPGSQRARRAPLAPDAWEQFADSVVSG